MTRTRKLARTVGARALLSAVPLLLGLAVACGGETIGAGGGGGDDGTDGRGTPDGGASHSSTGATVVTASSSGVTGATGITFSEGKTATAVTASGTIESETASGTIKSACVDVHLTAADLACDDATSCTFAPSGQVCSGACNGGTHPVNLAAANRIQSELSGLDLADCGEEAEEPTCIHGRCTACGGPDAPPCGGSTVDDAGSGPPPACVDVDPSTYKTTCAQASDCILIAYGELCDGGCSCPSAPVSASEQSTYDDAISGITFGLCGCPAIGYPSCMGGQCILCGFGNDPGGPATCPDGGS